MSKIERYTGNLRAFGSNAQGLERTLFGETTQADDLTSQVTNSFLRGWGIVGPSENPSMEDFNAAMYTMSQFIAYQHQMGIPEWDALQEYYSASICVRNGEAYLSLVDSNIGSAPPSAKWTSVLTAKNALANISGFLKSSNNLSEIKDAGPAAVAQTLLNLDLGEAAKSRVLQSGGDSVKDVMSQNAITYLLSLKAGVNGERVEAENFREALNLGNAALKNTGTGQGQLPDMSAFLSNQKMNGYQYLPGGLILQWGNTPCEDRRTAVSKFPIPFPNECLMVIVCGFQVAGTYQAYTVVNGEWNDQFSWNAFYAQSGNIPVLAAAGQVNARFLAIGR